MYITRLKAEGLATAVDHDALSRTTRVPKGSAAMAAADALTLWVAGMGGTNAGLRLAELGWVPRLPDPDPDGEPVARYDLWHVDPDGIAQALSHEVDTVTIDVSLAPDPPLYGRLREHAVRDPRLVTALGQQAELHVKIGWRLTAGRSFATSDLLGARIGDVSFPVVGKERPAWLLPLLSDVASRVHRVDLETPWSTIVETLHGAALSRDPVVRACWARVQSALTAQPFQLPMLHVVRTGARQDLGVGNEVLPSRSLDRSARDAIRLAAATLLRAPDVLIVPTALSEEVRGWLDSCTEGDEATLEQVITP